MNSEIDELDKKLMLHLCSGVHSYSELAEKCGVSRNTVYRRLNRLEKEGLLHRVIMALPNFMKLGLSAICIMMDIGQTDVERVLRFLKKQSQVKFLWRTYGSYNVTTVILCRRGEEGSCISRLREVLEKMRIKLNKFEVAVSFTWEKIDFRPY